MSGFDVVASGGSDCQSFRTWSYSAWLNASVASRSMAESVDDVGVRASARGQTHDNRPEGEQREHLQRSSDDATTGSLQGFGSTVVYHVEGVRTMAGAYRLSTYSLTIRLVQKRGALVRRLSFMSCNQPRGIPSRSR